MQKHPSLQIEYQERQKSTNGLAENKTKHDYRDEDSEAPHRDWMISED